MDIFDFFADKLGCYISDLRVLDSTDWEGMALEDIPAQAFSLAQWNEFLSYLFSEEFHCASAREAKAALIARLREPGV